MSNVRWFSALWQKFTNVSKCRAPMRATPHGAAAPDRAATARERYSRNTGRYSRNRVLGAAALAASAVWCAGCSNDKKVPLKETVEEAPSAPKLLSAVNMGDPKAEKQLLNGFYAIEANAWRWTAKDFSVALRPPPAAAAQGATLDFALSVPANRHRETAQRDAFGHHQRNRARPRDLFARRRSRLQA